MARSSTSKPLALFAAAFLLALSISARPVYAAGHGLEVTVAHASMSGSEIHPALVEIARNLRQLFEQRGIHFEFTSLRLKDEAVFKLAIGSSGRMQLPNGKWMTIQVSSLDQAKGMLRLVIAVEKLDFKATVGIAAGATAVLPGPDYQGGRLILVIKRPATAGG